MPIPQTVLQPNEWWPKKSNQMLLSHHTTQLKTSIEAKLGALLREYASQFTQDETCIGTTPLTEMMIDTGTSEPVSQKTPPIAMKHYQWVKNEIQKLLTANVIQESSSNWSPIIVFPKGDEGKCLVIDYCTLNKVTRKFIWPMPKVDDMFSQLNGAKYFSSFDLQAGYHHFSLDEAYFQRLPSPHHLGSTNTSKYHLDLHKLQHTSKNSWQEY